MFGSRLAYAYGMLCFRFAQAFAAGFADAQRVTDFFFQSKHVDRIFNAFAAVHETRSLGLSDASHPIAALSTRRAALRRASTGRMRKTCMSWFDERDVETEARLSQ